MVQAVIFISLYQGLTSKLGIVEAYPKVSLLISVHTVEWVFTFIIPWLFLCLHLHSLVL